MNTFDHNVFTFIAPPPSYADAMRSPQPSASNLNGHSIAMLNMAPPSYDRLQMHW